MKDFWEDTQSIRVASWVGWDEIRICIGDLGRIKGQLSLILYKQEEVLVQINHATTRIGNTE